MGFSPDVMEHFLNPRRTGPLPDPSGEGWSGSLTGSRYMRIQIRLEGGLITDARFATYGCAPAIACGSCLCEWAIGRTPSDVSAYNSDDLVAALGGLPESRRFCADLAVAALRAALSEAQTGTRPHIDI